MFHHIVDACVEFCFLKKQFLNLTINMQLLYFITTVTSQVHVSIAIIYILMNVVNRRNSDSRHISTSLRAVDSYLRQF